MITILATFIAYLIGSLSSAIIICKLLRLPDPRSTGSHNPGATNVLRIGGKKAAIITLVGDTLKGFIPLYICTALGFDALSLCFVGLAAFFGHLYPIFFQFKGGKGVATAFGCLLALNAWVGLASVLTWLVLIVCFRYASLASIIVAIFAPIYCWLLSTNYYYVLTMLIMSLFLLWRHRENMVRLIKGKENKLRA